MSAQIIPLRGALPQPCPRRSLAIEAQIAADEAAKLFEQLAKESAEPSFKRRAEVIRAAASGNIMDAQTALIGWRYF